MALVRKNHPKSSKRPHHLPRPIDNPEHSLSVESVKLRNPEIKKQRQCNPYVAGRSTSAGSKFWDNSQEKQFNEIYSSKRVFEHRFVDWSNIANPEICAVDVSIKYKNLGLKGLASLDATLVWNEEFVKQFYATVYINPDCTRMEFMIGSSRHAATKEDFEKALSIKPRASSIILHTSSSLNSTDALCLCVVPELNTKKVRQNLKSEVVRKNLKPEVDLIVKINEHTIFPRSGNRGGCTTVPHKLAHFIYHQKNFDIAHFLLSEMRAVIEKPDQALPYAPHIIRLLHHLKVIPENSSLPCAPKKYSPKLDAQAQAAVAQHEIQMGQAGQSQAAVAQHEIQVGQDGQAQAAVAQHEIQVGLDGQAQPAVAQHGIPEGLDGQAQPAVAQHGISEGPEVQAAVALHGIPERQDAQAQAAVAQHELPEGHDLIEQDHSSSHQAQQKDRFETLMNSIIQLSAKVDKLQETVYKGYKAMDVSISHLSSEVKMR